MVTESPGTIIMVTVYLANGHVSRWCNGEDVGLVSQSVAVQLPAVPLSDNNLRQVVHTYVPLLPSSINWYRSKSDDALRLGR